MKKTKIKFLSCSREMGHGKRKVESFGVWKLLDADPGCGGGVSPVAPYRYAVKTDPGITEAVMIKCL